MVTEQPDLYHTQTTHDKNYLKQCRRCAAYNYPVVGIQTSADAENVVLGLSVVWQQDKKGKIKMEEWIKYDDVYALEFHPDKLVNVQEVYDKDAGIWFEFDEPPNQKNSKKYKLTACLFDKDKWTPETAQEWWMDHLILFIPKEKIREKLGKKQIPDYDYFLDDIDGKGTHLFVISKNTPSAVAAKQLIKNDIVYKEHKISYHG